MVRDLMLRGLDAEDKVCKPASNQHFTLLSGSAPCI